MKPRLVVFRSNKYFYAQVTLDGKTVVSTGKMADPVQAGKEIAEKAIKNKITAVSFDRNGYKYHGNVKKLADAAREAGLIF